MLLQLVYVAFIYTTCIQSKSTKFLIQGAGEYDAGKWIMDIHVEATNTTATVTPNVTSPTVGPSLTPATTPFPALTSKLTTAPSITTTPTVSATFGFQMNSDNTTVSPATENDSTTTNELKLSDLDKQALQLHNYFRSIHESPMLSPSVELHRDAQEYAEKVAKSGLLKPEQDFVLKSLNEGENLGFRCSTNRPDPLRSIKLIMKRWYDEGCMYNFTDPSSSKYDKRHFTQMTWAGSKILGVGVAYGQVKNLQCIYFVARYSPPGNKGNKHTYLHNVKQGVFDMALCQPSVEYQFPKQEVLLRD